MKILVSNPSFQYTLQTVKALNTGGHDVFFATVYWFRPRRLFEKIIGLLFPSLQRKLALRFDPDIDDSKVVTRFSALLLQFFNRIQKKPVEENSYIDDCWHDNWVAKWTKANKPDLIIGYEKSCLKTFTAAKLYGAITWLDLSQVHPNYIRTLRGQYPFFKAITGNESLFRKISEQKIKEYEFANKILTLSEFAKSTLIQNNIKGAKVIVNALGYNPTIFYPGLTKTVDNSKPLQLIYAGIITKRKGIHLLLEVINYFNSNEIELTLIGPKGDASLIIDAYKGRVKITYIEACSQNELANYLRVADVFVFPSYLDSWAAVVPEAMACGLPIIATSATGSSQLVKSDCGIVIEPNNREALEMAIKYFIDNRNSILMMGNKAMIGVENYTWKKYEERLFTYLCAELQE